MKFRPIYHILAALAVIVIVWAAFAWADYKWGVHSLRLPE